MDQLGEQLQWEVRLGALRLLIPTKIAKTLMGILNEAVRKRVQRSRFERFAVVWQTDSFHDLFPFSATGLTELLNVDLKGDNQRAFDALWDASWDETLIAM